MSAIPGGEGRRRDGQDPLVPSAEDGMSQSLLTALLLIGSGDFMDAYTYIAYAHVFTNAQSGNVVLLAIALSTLDWAQAFKHVPALVGFFPGVFAGRTIAGHRTTGHSRADLIILAAQTTLLAAVALAGERLSAAIVTFTISLASAMQNTGFKKVDGVSHTSVVTTGNLRSLSEALHAEWVRGDPDALRKARTLGAICAAFALGALAGAIVTPVWGRAALWSQVSTVAIVLVVRTLGQRRVRRPNGS